MGTKNRKLVKLKIPDSFDQMGQLLKCDKGSVYVYPEFEFESSLVTEIDLVCGEEYKVRPENALAELWRTNDSVITNVTFQGCADQQHLHERHDRRLIHRGKDHGLDRAEMGKGIHLDLRVTENNSCKIRS